MCHNGQLLGVVLEHTHVDLQGASKAHDFATNLSRGPREYLVAVRSEGQFLGEMAMFATAAVRCASVRAKGPVRVKIVPGEELMDLSPEVRFNVAVAVPACSLLVVLHCTVLVASDQNICSFPLTVLFRLTVLQ